jgi:hypothetical protein
MILLNGWLIENISVYNKRWELQICPYAPLLMDISLSLSLSLLRYIEGSIWYRQQYSYRLYPVIFFPVAIKKTHVHIYPYQYHILTDIIYCLETCSRCEYSWNLHETPFIVLLCAFIMPKLWLCKLYNKTKSFNIARLRARGCVIHTL